MSAQLSIIREIDNAIEQSSGERRAHMARRLTDLFLLNLDKYSEEEIALIDDVFIRLVATIEESSRALLATRLGPVSKAPPKIINALARDDAIFVASPVLMYSETLDDLTLIECAKSKSQHHLLAISRRKTLPETITDLLVERGDELVALSTAQNAGAKFSDKGFTTLIKRSVGNDRLAICVGKRPDLSRELFEQLLEVASDVVCRRLSAESPHAAREIDRAVADVTAQVRTEAAARSQDYAAAQVLVDLQKRAGQLTNAKLESFAKAERYEETMVALAALAGIPTDVAVRRLDDDFAAFVLLLAKAINLSWPATKSILSLGCKRNRCSADTIEQSSLDFQQLDRQTAQKRLAIHRTKSTRELCDDAVQ